VNSKIHFFILALLYLLVTAHTGMAAQTNINAEETATMKEISQKLDNKQYSQAMSLINRAIRTHSGDPQTQAPYIKLFADFNRDVCGNIDKALMSYRRIINSGLPPTHQLIKRAQKDISRIYTLRQQYQPLDNEIKTHHDMVNRKRDKNEIRADIEQLEDIVNLHPDYYLMHEVYYLLAIDYEALQEPGNVYRFLKKAMDLKPGIVFYLPVKFRAQKARAADIQNKINGTVCTLFWILLFTTMIIFYKSRPWQWLRIRHAVLLAAMMLIWWLFFTLSHFAVGAIYENSRETLIVAEQGKDTEYRHAGPGSPGSEQATPLFHYGLIGIAAIFIFTAALKHLGPKKNGMLPGIVYGLLIFLAISTHFYMKHCYQIGEFKSDSEGFTQYLTGQIHYSSEEPEPHVLTNPLAYPGLELKNIEDPYLKEWVKKYCLDVKE
jgi:hypothetical protein